MGKSMARLRKVSRERQKYPSTPPNARRALTPRQKEILRLVSQGLTNREIAERLHISVRTVEVHRFNLMRRLRVKNVAQLLRQALVLRLLPKSFASV
jgi:DNA-binding NarL/FixJ family response regulator